MVAVAAACRGRQGNQGSRARQANPEAQVGLGEQEERATAREAVVVMAAGAVTEVVPNRNFDRSL